MIKKHYKNFLNCMIFFVIFSLSIGYSAFSLELSISNIVADVRVKSDIRITSFLYNTSTSSATSSYENYDVDSVMGNIVLPNESSTITYKIAVTNFGNVEMGIYSITGLPSNLTYELSDYKLHDKICDSTGGCTLGINKVITITVKYKDGGFNSSSTEYNLKLDFDFRKIHKVTYEGITNNNYPSYVIDGGTLTFTATSNIPPKIVAFTSTGERYKYDLYSYSNNVFTFNNVPGDVKLKYQEKAYLKTLTEDTDFKESTYKTTIDSVQFVNYVDTAGAVEIYDLSEISGSKDVVGWITSENDLYIGSDWDIYAKDLSRAFQDMSGVTNVVFNNLNTSETTTMYYMFKGMSSLTSLDVSSFNTTNVTNMSRMFNVVSSLSHLNINNFNTSNVTNMSNMFSEMSSLTSLDVSNFNTSNVTNMSNMFAKMSSLKNLDLSNFNTSKVTKMSSMFLGMSSLTSLDISSFNTTNVTTMQQMFEEVKALTTLDVSHFNTDKVTGYGMYGMFGSMSQLKSLDLSNFNTSKVTRMDYMFNYSNLSSLNISNFNTENVTCMAGMFAGTKLTELDLKHFNTSKVTRMDRMFSNTHELERLDISNFDTSNVTNMSEMFQSTGKLDLIYFNNADFSNVSSYSKMFNMSGYNTSSPTLITVKDENAKIFIENRLAEYSIKSEVNILGT